MKKYLLIMLMAIGFSSQAFTTGPQDTLIVKSSMVCEMCAETISEGLKFNKGIQDISFNMATNEIMVVYNAKKQSPEKIKKVISELGYDASDVKRTQEAYDKLHGCCKAPH